MPNTKLGINFWSNFLRLDVDDDGRHGYNALVSLKSSSDLQLQLSEGGVEGAFTMVSAAAWQRFFSFF